jgi:serine O-acetyltransferase
MAKLRSQISQLDPVWQRITQEASAAVADEPLLGGMLHACILHHAELESALAYRLAQKLSSGEMSEQLLREMADEAYLSIRILATRRGPISWRSLTAIPPATDSFSRSFTSRASRPSRPIAWATGCGRKGAHDIAYFIQMRVSEVFGIDIHPAARIGRGHHDRPRPFHRDRRDGGGGRQCLDAAFGDAGRHWARKPRIVTPRSATAS